ncbi:hypothetical protein AB1Y20_017942 [Prymnesium parvum]|uniref:Uncharacterized protein n=1 Tax=Prymnesium parvum TaxID=97485 RepID=A0AB34JN42_PRYPA
MAPSCPPARRGVRPARSANNRSDRLVKAREEAELALEALRAKIQADDKRLQLLRLQSRALLEKRQADAFDPTPARRRMYDDRELALASQIPGPAEYTPRLLRKATGKTFGASERSIGSGTGSSKVELVRDKRHLPGPASYTPGVTPHPQRSPRSSSFGPPPHIAQGRVVRSAHDVSYRISHLIDLPSPGAYSPQSPRSTKRGVVMKPSSARSSRDRALKEASALPGPGSYAHELALKFNSIYRCGPRLGFHPGKLKSSLDLEIERASATPGPGAYDHFGQLRRHGVSRFGTTPQAGLLEAIQKEAGCTPGPDAYHPSPTFEEELEMRRYKKAIIEGDSVPWNR